MEKRKRQVEESPKDNTDDSNSGSSTSVDKASFVWDHFDKYKDDKGIIWAKCQHCSKGTYNMNASNFSTGNLIKHLKTTHLKNDLSTEKQVQFMSKFFDNNLQIVSI